MPQILDTPVAEDSRLIGQQNRRFWNGLLTATIAALVIFAAINFLLWRVAGEERATTNDLWSGTGSIDLAVNGYKQLDHKPDVVLIGSSLMMYPFWSMDKERDPSISDIFHHHFSHTLEDQMLKAGYKNPTVYSMAIFGQMSSDAYIYVDEFLKGDKTPKYLVYGLAPRDFSDYDLPTPTATYTFKRLVGLTNFDRYASLYLPNWQDRADFLINHMCFFYGRRWRLQKEVDKILNKVYQIAGFATEQQSNKAPQEGAGFMVSGSAEERWANSLNEYRRRYRNIGDRDLSVQMGFLTRLLTVARQRGIKVILVNMPLTDVNRALLPTGFYNNFSNTIAQMATTYGARFVDLGASPDFVHEDYWDTTHLNQAGGHILLKHIAPLLQQDKR